MLEIFNGFSKYLCGVYLIIATSILSGCDAMNSLKSESADRTTQGTAAPELDLAKIIGIPITQNVLFNLELSSSRKQRTDSIHNDRYFVVWYAHCDLHVIDRRDHDIFIQSAEVQLNQKIDVLIKGEELYRKIAQSNWSTKFTHYMLKFMLISVSSQRTDVIDDPNKYEFNQVLFGSTLYLDQVGFSLKEFPTSIYGIDPDSGKLKSAPTESDVQLTLSASRQLTNREYQ